MNVPSASSQDIFDVRKIRRLVELMKEHDLSEIDLQQGEVRIQLRRAGAAAPAGDRPRRGGAGRGRRAAPARRRRSPTRPRPPEAKAGGIAVIKSPMVGTFYAAADPDSPAVRQGRRPRRAGNDRLHRRGHEGLQPDPGGGRRPDHRRAGRERRAGGVRAAPVQGRYAGVAVFKRILVANRGEIALRDLSRLPRAGHRDRGHLQRGRPRRRLPGPGRRGLSASARPRPPTAI